MEFEHTHQTTATPAQIWRIWTDVGTWHTWDEIQSATIKGDFVNGAEGILLPKPGQSSRFVLSNVRPDKGYLLTVFLPGCRLNIYRSIVEHTGPTTRFRHAVSFAGTTAFLFGPLLGPGFRTALPAVMMRIARSAEALPTLGEQS